MQELRPSIRSIVNISMEPILINSLSNRILADFMRCPYRFYWKNLRKKGGAHTEWREVVQYIVNQVIQDFYQSPVEKRSAFQILHLIENHWRIGIDLFGSKQEYYTVLAKVTDHLMQYLHRSEGLYPPLFLNEKINVYSEELQTQLSTSIQVSHWTNKTYNIKKYLVTDEQSIIDLYKHFMIVFSYEAFQVLPEYIEVVSLLHGKTSTVFPTMKDVEQSTDYLRVMIEVLKDPKNYFQANSNGTCRSCPFLDECSTDKMEKTATSTIQQPFFLDWINSNK